MTALGFRTEEEHPTSPAHLATVIYVTKRAVYSHLRDEACGLFLKASERDEACGLSIKASVRNEACGLSTIKASKHVTAFGLSISKGP